MKVKKVKEVMIPLLEYATVNEEDTLETAVKTLLASHQTMDQSKYKHRVRLNLNTVNLEALNILQKWDYPDLA